ncbi:peptidase S8/S53 domain-containing protein [Corynascus similis CBS 632.67]
MKLTRSLGLRALCALSSFNGALAAPAVAKDEIALRAAIAVKLNSSASLARSVAGADIVEDLVRKALSNSGHSKREAQFNVLPLITTLTLDQISEMIERATKLTPSYKPGDFSSWFQVQFPQYAADEENPEITQLLSKLAAHVVGITRTVSGVPVENEPEAILDAANYLAPGDVMLLEMQTGDANGDLWPVEILDAQFDAISLATALGIIVIEPAANGGMDMDQPVLRPGDTTAVAILNRSSPEFRDSGAVVVGAGSAALPRSRLPFSNYGSRVDVHSWGEGITTSSVVTSDFSNDDTYDEFSGTSGASPIVAGAALSIQGMVQANRGARLTPAEMRNLLTVGGTPSADPAADKIGVQPDLRALIDGGYLE